MYFFKNRCAYLVISHIFYIQKSYRKCPVEVCHRTASLQHQLGSDPVSKYTSCKVVMSVEKDKRTEYIPKIMLFSTHSPSLAYAARWFSKKHRSFLRTLSCHPTMQPLRQTSGDPKKSWTFPQVFRGSIWQNNGCLKVFQNGWRRIQVDDLMTEKKCSQIIWGLLLVGDDVWSGATRRFAGGTTARDCAEAWGPLAVQGRLQDEFGLITDLSPCKYITHISRIDHFEFQPAHQITAMSHRLIGWWPRGGLRYGWYVISPTLRQVEKDRRSSK